MSADLREKKPKIYRQKWKQFCAFNLIKLINTYRLLQNRIILRTFEGFEDSSKSDIPVFEDSSPVYFLAISLYAS
jgi:hypothetical protein